jgi:hypothetical protein
MQKFVASASPSFPFPPWTRIAMASVMFAVSAVTMWTAFSRLDWVASLCFGIYYLIYIPMQKGEPRRAYFSKPRTMFSFVLLTAVLAAALHSLHYVFTKYRA